MVIFILQLSSFTASHLCQTKIVTASLINLEVLLSKNLVFSSLYHLYIPIGSMVYHSLKIFFV
jgi:hypothetical protein